MLLVLDSFIYRIQQDARPLLLSVYAELGVIIAGLGRAVGSAHLPEEARTRAGRLLESELRSAQSRFQTYDHFRSFVHRIMGKGLQGERLDNLSRSLLEAALLDMPAKEIALYGDEYEEELERGEDLHILLDRILCSLGETVVSPRARTSTVGSIISFVSDSVVERNEDQEIGPTEANATKSDRRTLIETGRELAWFSEKSSFWIALHEDDQAKANCLQLIGLLETLADLNPIDHRRFDILNGRAEIFETLAN